MTRRIPVTLRSTTTAMILAATLVAPAALSAQVTTFIAPPRKAADSAKVAPVVAKARADSVARMRLTDMKAWVDSAAGVSSTQVASANDTTTANAVAATSAVPTTPDRTTTTTFSNGAIAPNTASPLPAYLLAGLASLIVGMLLFRLRPRRAKG
jgi:hypothetical protein